MSTFSCSWRRRGPPPITLPLLPPISAMTRKRPVKAPFGSRMALLRSIAAVLCCCSCSSFREGAIASAFVIPPLESLLPTPIQHSVVDLTSAQQMIDHMATSLSSPSTTILANSIPADLLSAYKNQLASHPLQTKMITGATVALCGDAIAQSQVEEPYDRRRAASFMTFDACYRWTQHELYPIIVRNMQGQYLGGLVGSIPPLAAAAKATSEATGTEPAFFFSVMEQTLSSQLGIVPFIYYPVFYTITGFLQQLTPNQTVERAKETFVPLMKRNLLFWIPVQFVQFGFVEENLQIPFITVCGLIWTIILSVMAGAAQKNDRATEESRDMASDYCITGLEEGCEINPDDLFPHVLEDVIDMDTETRLELEEKIIKEPTNAPKEDVDVEKEELVGL